jgi:hypothetical protein
MTEGAARGGRPSGAWDRFGDLPWSNAQPRKGTGTPSPVLRTGRPQIPRFCAKREAGPFPGRQQPEVLDAPGP